MFEDNNQRNGNLYNDVVKKKEAAHQKGTLREAKKRYKKLKKATAEAQELAKEFRQWGKLRDGIISDRFMGLLRKVIRKEIQRFFRVLVSEVAVADRPDLLKFIGGKKGLTMLEDSYEIYDVEDYR